MTIEIPRFVTLRHGGTGAGSTPEQRMRRKFDDFLAKTPPMLRPIPRAIPNGPRRHAAAHCSAARGVDGAVAPPPRDVRAATFAVASRRAVSEMVAQRRTGRHTPSERPLRSATYSPSGQRRALCGAVARLARRTYAALHGRAIAPDHPVISSIRADRDEGDGRSRTGSWRFCRPQRSHFATSP